MDKKSNFRRGSVELLVLHLLSQRDYYGYELTQIMKTQSDGIMDIPVGSLYPALYKLTTDIFPITKNRSGNGSHVSIII